MAEDRDMEAMLEGVLETLGKNPELAELAGKLVGLEPPESVQNPKGNVSQDANESDSEADGSERAVSLLKALRPYMNSDRGSSVDRLLKVLPTAKAIRTALHAFGSIT